MNEDTDIEELKKIFNYPVETVTEGSAKILIPRRDAFRKDNSDRAASKAPVFYNLRMKLNRDIAIAVLQTFQKNVNRELRVTEPLTGCGVRGIRFSKEVGGIHKIYLNDINSEAFKIAQYNISLNAVGERIILANEDANFFLSGYSGPHRRFDYIDIDPFGSPTIYMDSAVRALRDGGLIALTATDLATLCGVYPKAALRKYGGLSLRTEYCHELALRLLCGCLASVAAKHDAGVKALLSYYADHYIRLYATVSYGAKSTDESIRKMGYVLHCFTCFHRETATGLISDLKLQCPECGSLMKIAGPLWIGKICEEKFCEKVKEEAATRHFDRKNDVMKILSLLVAESSAPATYYVIDRICDKVGIPIPRKRDVIEVLKKNGFKAHATHFNSRGVKTDAPAKKVTEIIKEIVT